MRKSAAVRLTQKNGRRRCGPVDFRARPVNLVRWLASKTINTASKRRSRSAFNIVPDYQREYVWTEKEVRQLLGDIDEQVEAVWWCQYFIGTVLVSPGSRKAQYEVIDG